jgi:hypothetical protein
MKLQVFVLNCGQMIEFLQVIPRNAIFFIIHLLGIQQLLLAALISFYTLLFPSPFVFRIFVILLCKNLVMSDG